MRAIFKSIFKVLCISLLKGPMGLAFGYTSRIVVLDLEIINFGVNRCRIPGTAFFVPLSGNYVTWVFQKWQALDCKCYKDSSCVSFSYYDLSVKVETFLYPLNLICVQ